MKEYARATAGVGPYARFAAAKLPGPDQLVQQTLGDEWRLVEDTVRAKPNRVLISDGTTKLLMLWGAPRNMRDLTWAALVSKIDEGLDSMIILTSTRAQTLSTSERRRLEAVGALAGIDVRHTTVTVRRRTGQPPASSLDA